MLPSRRFAREKVFCTLQADFLRYATIGALITATLPGDSLITTRLLFFQLFGDYFQLASSAFCSERIYNFGSNCRGFFLVLSDDLRVF